MSSFIALSEPSPIGLPSRAELPTMSAMELLLPRAIEEMTVLVATVLVLAVLVSLISFFCSHFLAPSVVLSIHLS
jgi:hypothetical protein